MGMKSGEKKEPAAVTSEKPPLDDEKSVFTPSKSNAGKKLWSREALNESLKPSNEEYKFREEKLKEKNIILKNKKYFRCTKCLLNFNSLIQNKEVIPVHPILGVLMCQKCCDYYEDGEFSLDSDGEDKYCRWCGEGGTIFGCTQCISGFCASCIKRHFEKNFHKKVQNDDNWVCFICNPKPLWFLRFICSLAIKQSKDVLPKEQSTHKNTIKKLSIRNTNKATSEELSIQKTSNNKSEELSTQNTSNDTSKELSNQTTSKDNSDELFTQNTTSKEFCTQKSSPESSKIKLSNKRKNIKKRFCISSSDESEQDEQPSPQKKRKLTENPVTCSSNNSKTKPIEKETLSLLEELEKVLKLSESQLRFGATWTQKILKKIRRPNFSSTDIAKECHKVKWFLSLLSTYLVQFCNSVNSIEKNSLKGSETTNVPRSNESSYATILQFLGFINTQVKTFMEKGIDLSDVLEAEIYDDENVIGIKKKLNSKSGSFNDENSLHSDNKTNLTPNEMEESTEELKVDSDESRDKSDDGIDTIGDQNTEINCPEFDKELNCSSISTVGVNDLRSLDPEEDIQEILAILENA